MHRLREELAYRRLNYSSCIIGDEHINVVPKMVCGHEFLMCRSCGSKVLV